MQIPLGVEASKGGFKPISQAPPPVAWPLFTTYPLYMLCYVTFCGNYMYADMKYS